MRCAKKGRINIIQPLKNFHANGMAKVTLYKDSHEVNKDNKEGDEDMQYLAQYSRLVSKLFSARRTGKRKD